MSILKIIAKVAFNQLANNQRVKSEVTKIITDKVIPRAKQQLDNARPKVQDFESKIIRWIKR